MLPPTNLTTQDSLMQLAKYLAANLVCHSVDKESEINDIAQNHIHDYDEGFTKSRNILILGAGATTNANNEIKPASKFVTLIKGLFPTKQLNEQLEYLSRVYNLHRDEFETVMLACSKLDNEKVHRALKSCYDYKHVPNLFFEIVAHLFKHRFIDIIINFNFDEVMDNVIEDEMSGMEYHSIISDGDLSEELEDLMFSHRLKKPVYLKPHGTISHPSSLRFNKEQYYALPTRIAQLLKMLFEANYNKKNKKLLKLNFIVVGFGMQSIDLNHILNEALTAREKLKSPEKAPVCNFFVFDMLEKHEYLSNISKTTSSDKIQLLFKNDDHLRYILTEPKTGKTDTEQLHLKDNTLESLFLQLWKNIEATFKQQQMIRSISRHLIISEVFAQTDKTVLPLRIFQKKDKLNKGNEQKSEFYLHMRIYTELAILLIQSGGIINITQLKQSRVDKYYALYAKVNKLLKQERNKDTRLKIDKSTIAEYLEDFGFKKYKGYSGDTFVCIPPSKKTFKNYILTRLLIKIKELKRKFPKPAETISFDDALLRKYVDQLAANPGWEIKPNFKEYDVSKFRNIKEENFLHTDFRFNYWRQQLFDKDWNVVLSVNKKAGYIIEDNELGKQLKGSNKHMFAVLSKTDIASIDKVNKVNLDGYNCYPYPLHWRDLNQHLQLFIKFRPVTDKSLDRIAARINQAYKKHPKDDTAFSLIEKAINRLINQYTGGIYYQRRQLSRKANPLVFLPAELKNQHIENCQELFNIFVSYWGRTGAEKAQSNKIEYAKFLEQKVALIRMISHKLRGSTTHTIN
jgi:hypothetical protein